MSRFYDVRNMDKTYQRIYMQGIRDAWDTFKQLVSMTMFSEKYNISDLKEILDTDPPWSVIKDMEDFNRETIKRKEKLMDLKCIKVDAT